MITSRRTFLTGLASLMAAPAIVRASSLMPVKVLPSVEELDALTIIMHPDMYAELSVITRKAFVPRLSVQIYETTPLLKALQPWEQP